MTLSNYCNAIAEKYCEENNLPKEVVDVFAEEGYIATRNLVKSIKDPREQRVALTKVLKDTFNDLKKSLFTDRVAAPVEIIITKDTPVRCKPTPAEEISSLFKLANAVW